MAEKILLSLLFLSGILTQASATPQQKIRDLFEWGEYSQLIEILEPMLDTASGMDSTVLAQFQSFLGVAYFASGNIAEARSRFLKAFQCDSLTGLDEQYVTGEMLNLFYATRTEFLNQKKALLYQDSLLIAKQVAFDLNLQKMKKDALQRRKKSNSIFAVSFIGLSAAFLGIAYYEYHTTREPFSSFKNAAQAGDKSAYDQFRPIIKRANIIIIGSELAAGTCCISGFYFTLRAGKLNQELKKK